MHHHSQDAPPSVLLVGNIRSGAGKTPTTCSALAERLKAAGIGVITTSRQSSRMLRLVDMVWTTWGARRRYQCAYVELYSGLSFIWAEAVSWTLRRARKPFVLALHGGNLPAFARTRPNRVRRLLGSADVVTAPSAYLSEGLRSYRDGIRVVPNALRLEAYPFRCRTGARPRLVWLRAFHDIYNPSMAARVVAEVRRTEPDVQLVMGGPDDGDGSLGRMVKLAGTLGVLDRISRPGKIAKAHVPAFLDAADIFLNTTNIDNSPVSVLEAMACGLCVVSTNVGGVPYLVRHEHDALLVEPDDAAAMATAARRVLIDADLAKRLSSHARETAARCDWSAVLPQWLSLFETLKPK